MKYETYCNFFGQPTIFIIENRVLVRHVTYNWQMYFFSRNRHHYERKIKNCVHNYMGRKSNSMQWGCNCQTLDNILYTCLWNKWSCWIPKSRLMYDFKVTFNHSKSFARYALNFSSIRVESLHPNGFHNVSGNCTLLYWFRQTFLRDFGAFLWKYCAEFWENICKITRIAGCSYIYGSAGPNFHRVCWIITQNILMFNNIILFFLVEMPLPLICWGIH